MRTKKVCFFSIVLLLLPALVLADDSPDPEYGWQPRIYEEGFFQAGRNICLGIAIAEDATPGLSHDYTIARFVVGVSQGVELHHNHFFNKEDAFASVNINYPDKTGQPKSTVLLFIITDFCLEDKETEYEYGIVKGDAFRNVGEYIDIAYFDYSPTGTPCRVLTDISCTDMDLTTFYGWADKTKEEWEQEEEAEYDDDDTVSSDNDDDDDDGCGCMVNRQGSGLTTFIVMVLIGCLFLVFRKRVIK